MKAIKPDGTEVDIGRPEASSAARIVKHAAITPRQQAILVLRRQARMSTRRIAHAFGITWRTVKAEEARGIAALTTAMHPARLGISPRKGTTFACRIP